MPNPVQMTFGIQTPQGVQPMNVIVQESDTPQQAAQKLQARGQQVVSFGGVSAIPEMQKPAAPQAPRKAPGLGSDIASAAGQIGLGALGRVVGGRPGAMLGGLIGGLAPYVAGRRGMPSAGEVAGVAAGEVPLVGAARAIPQAIRGSAAQALEGSGLIQKAARTAVETIHRRPTAIAGELLNTAKGITRGAEPMMAKALAETTKSFGVDLAKMNDRQFLDLVRETPERAAAAIAAFEKASGRRLADPGVIQRLWVSDVLHGSARSVREGAQRAKGLLVEPGGSFILDGKMVSDAWNGLSAEGKATFGATGRRAFDDLTTALDRLKKAPKGIRQLTGQQVPMTAPFAAIMRVVNALPGGKLTGVGLGTIGMMEAVPLMREVGAHPVLAGTALAGAGAIRLGKRGASALMDRLLSTPEGVQWLTSGVDQMSRGLPSVLIADTMSRSLMRSPALLGSLGVAGAAAGPLPGQQAAFQPPGLAAAGMR